MINRVENVKPISQWKKNYAVLKHAKPKFTFIIKGKMN